METGPEQKRKTRRISIEDARHFGRDGYSGDIFVEKDSGLGFNALLVDVYGRHYRTRIKGAARNYFVVKGQGTFTIDGKKEEVTPGDLFVITDSLDYEYEGNMTLLEFNVPATDSSNEINLDEQSQVE